MTENKAQPDQSVRIFGGFYGASTGTWRAETRGAPSAAISNNSRDGHDANDAD